MRSSPLHHEVITITSLTNSLYYVLQVYWFKFIVSLLVKILIYQEKLEDNREYDEEKEKKKKQEVKTEGKDGKKEEDGKNRREQKNGPNPQKGDKKEQ